MSEATADARLRAPATERNREPILSVLRDILPPRGAVLEIASGTGEHAAFLAARLPRLIWQPSERDARALASIEAWRLAAGAPPNLHPPVALDVEAADWAQAASAAVPYPVALVAINLLHIAPWSAAQNLFAGAGRLLVAQRVLFLYGPYRRDGQHTSISNAHFDRQLRAENPDWGLRDLEEVAALGAEHGLDLEEVVRMPANNLSLVFRRR